MYNEKKIFLLKNFLVYLGCVFTGAICSTFLDFNVKFDNDILLLILTISGVLISWVINFFLRKKERDFKNKDNKLLILLSLIIILVLRLFPNLYPKSMIELVIFLSFIFIMVTLQDLIIRNN